AGANWVNAGNALPEIKLTVSDGEETGRGADTPEVILVDDAPVATDDDFVVELGSDLEGNLITDNNGNGSDYDVDSDALSISHINGQLVVFDDDGTASIDIDGGTLIINRDGTFEYQYSGNEPSEVKFTYTITDGSSYSEAAEVIININDTTEPNAPTVLIIDDENDDGTLTQDEMGIDGVQIKVTIAHDELLNGGQVDINVVLSQLDGTVIDTRYVATLTESGEFVVTHNGIVVTGFTYDSDTGEITWTESEPAEGESISVKAKQIDGSGNGSDPSTDMATVEIVPSAPTLELKSSNLLASLNFEGIHSVGFRQDVKASSLDDLFVGNWGTYNSSGNLEIGTAGTYLNSSASAGHGYVLELENHGGDKSLYLDVELTEGRLYNFDFEAAARTHAGASSSNFSVTLQKLDESGNPTGETITIADVRFLTTNQWQQINESLSVDGSGTYRITFMANDSDTLGALLDNISFSEQINQGVEGNFIKISEITSALTDQDEVLSITLSGLPAGAKVKGLLSNGSESSVLTVGADGTLDIPSDWDYKSIFVQTSEEGVYSVDVTATSTETDGSQATTTSSFDLIVYPEGYEAQDPVANTANIISTLGTGATIDIPEEWLLHSDTTPFGTQIIGVNGAQTNNGTISIEADNSGEFDYTISSFGKTSTDSVDIDLVANTGAAIEGDANDNIMIADPNGGAVNFYGRQGDDVIVGGNSGDDLKGNLGNDLIIGGLGNDVINGGNNEDIIIGGLGDDILTGDGVDKQNIDVFKWESGDQGKDIITDFEFGYDKLDLSDLLIDEHFNNIDDYLTIRIDGDNIVLDIFADGDKSGEYDQQIVLENLNLTIDEVREQLLNAEGEGALIIDDQKPATDEQPVSGSGSSFDEFSYSIDPMNHIP
ncbi:hypothetical protein SOPP22_19760, partial [Shewanella sp. OPT22]